MGLATSALAIVFAILLGIWWGQPAYVMPFWVVLVGGICAVLTGIGSVLAARRRQVTPWLAPTVALTVLLGFLAAGVLVLPPLIVVLALLLVVKRRSPRLHMGTPRRQVSAGLILTLGLVPLCALVLLRGPVLECLPQGVGGGTPIWIWLGSLGSGSGSGGSGSGPISYPGPAETYGRVTVGGTTYAFVCAGTTLVNFNPATR